MKKRHVHLYTLHFLHEEIFKKVQMNELCLQSSRKGKIDLDCSGAFSRNRELVKNIHKKLTIRFC